MRILLISGHGNGDSGAVGNGCKEADLTRRATYLLEGKLDAYACAVTRYPTSRNAYEDNKNGKNISWKEYDLVVEIHFNSYNKEAHGTEVLYKPDAMKKLAAKVSSAIASVGFLNRGAKKRLDLLNMNTCARLNVPYILVETCFIDNKADMDLYKQKIESIWHLTAKAICDYYGIKKLASAGGDAVKNGWQKVNGDWYYYDKGNPVKDTWKKDSKGWCYLGSDGKQAKSRWVKYKDNWYYIKADGYMADGEWVKYKDNWYYLTPGGKMATGQMSITHKFDKDGKCVK